MITRVITPQILDSDQTVQRSDAKNMLPHLTHPSPSDYTCNHHLASGRRIPRAFALQFSDGTPTAQDLSAKAEAQTMAAQAASGRVITRVIPPLNAVGAQTAKNYRANFERPHQYTWPSLGLSDYTCNQSRAAGRVITRVITSPLGAHSPTELHPTPEFEPLPMVGASRVITRVINSSMPMLCAVYPGSEPGCARAHVSLTALRRWVMPSWHRRPPGSTIHFLPLSDPAQSGVRCFWAVIFRSNPMT